MLVDHLRAQVEWRPYVGRQHGVGGIGLLNLVHKAPSLFGLRGLLLVDVLFHFIFTGKAEIADFDESLAIDEYVGWFQISMDDVLIVNMPNAMQQLREDVKVLLPINPLLHLCSPLQEVLQCVARTEFHLDHDMDGHKIISVLCPIGNGRLSQRH